VVGVARKEAGIAADYPSAKKKALQVNDLQGLYCWWLFTVSNDALKAAPALHFCSGAILSYCLSYCT
jgi:hypothetical protein